MATLLVQHLPDLKRLARRLERDAARAADLVQEACRRALEAQRQFIPGTDARAWLLRILRNLHSDHLRRTSREILVGDLCDVVAAPGPSARPRWRDVSDEQVATALAALPSTYREPYVLHAVEGKTYSEIAHQLRIPLNTVGTRLLRARARLRQALTAETAEAQF